MRIPHGLRAALAGQGGAAPATDSDFENVSLLLHGDGTNGAQNNTFTDGSTNNFTITRNGNTTQGTFSPFSPTGWSGYFDGTGDYLSWSGTTLSGDFTVECWVYKTATDASGYTNVFSSSSQNTQLAFDNTTAGSIVLVINASVVIGVSGTAVTPNTWHHLAWVREGSTCRAYVNGVQQGTGTSSASMNLSLIGRFSSGGYEMNGYISNARITNACLYPGGTTFTPSTSPLTTTVSSGTVQLLTLQDNRFKDNSTNNFAITSNGDTKIEAFSPFNPTAAYSASTHGGSGYFDGTGDALTFPSNSALALGNGDFTVEAWIYNQNGVNLYPDIVANSGSIIAFLPSDRSSIYRSILSDDNYPGGGNAALLSASATIPQNTWTHLAWVRSGSTITVYINGVASGTATSSTNHTREMQVVGAIAQGAAPNLYFWYGYISNLRVLKGTALYTSAFTPPTAPLTAITNTSLLLNFTNGGIIDNASKNVLETVGNAQISTSVKKFGTGSMYFDGTGDYLITPSNTAFDFGSGNFTIEFWVFTGQSGFQAFVGTRTGDTASTIRLSIFKMSSNELTVNVRDTANNNIADFGFQSTLPVNQWVHCAFVRNGTNFRLYQDGVQSTSSATSSAAVNNSSNVIRVGDFGSSIISNLNGYIDDLRITKGVARYTANFTPPTAAFPDL